MTLGPCENSTSNNNSCVSDADRESMIDSVSFLLGYNVLEVVVLATAFNSHQKEPTFKYVETRVWTTFTKEQGT